MSVTGYTIDALADVILAGLVGATITAPAASGFGDLVLSQAEDDKDPTIGAYPMADGGVVVEHIDGRTSGRNAVPQSTGGCIQKFWRQNYAVRISYDVAGVTGQRLSAYCTALKRQVVNLIEATLQPASGVNWNVEDIAIQRVQRHPSRSGFYMQEFTVGLLVPWGRT